jgi:bifunctional pyridoxal-dependent enzyme with beta-cystathionase and maltose regulon repressor activities
MNVLQVIYDLNRPGQNYNDLIEYLKSQHNWCRPLESTWIVVTTKSTTGLRDEIKRFIDANDEVLVMDVKGDYWACLGLSKQVTDWLQENV